MRRILLRVGARNGGDPFSRARRTLVGVEPTVTPETLLADVVASTELERGDVLPETRAVMLALGRGELTRAEAEARMKSLSAARLGRAPGA